MRLYIIANYEKPQVKPALDEMLPWLNQRVEVVGVDSQSKGDLSDIQADVVLVMGGDGTLLSAARRLNGRQIPMMGINFGKLGFLSSFTQHDFPRHFEALLRNELPIRPRIMLEASVIPAGIDCRLMDPEQVAQHRRFVSMALNDAVITAGPPFHMIELVLSADGQTSVRYYGDGVIIATPSGSTAYNVSAGGPILSPGVQGFCITPICPHSLSFRPVVVAASSTVLITAAGVNEGTTLFCDGQTSTKLNAGDRVVVRRGSHDVLLVENPDIHGWRTLAEKLHWAIGPRYNI